MQSIVSPCDVVWDILYWTIFSWRHGFEIREWTYFVVFISYVIDGSRGVPKVVTDGHILHQLAKALWVETIKQRKQSDCSMLSSFIGQICVSRIHIDISISKDIVLIFPATVRTIT